RTAALERVVRERDETLPDTLTHLRAALTAERERTAALERVVRERDETIERLVKRLGQ
ncbi:hypothetical protein HK104_002973, partial [Borealophlyctis nickersoniae]